MKHKLLSKLPKAWFRKNNKLEAEILYGTQWVEAHLAPGWWKHPVFDFGLHYPMPYIWFAYWLITWEEEVVFPQFNQKWFYWRFPKIHTPSAPCFSVIHISISFMPD
jgi:hypothetical protein